MREPAVWRIGCRSPQNSSYASFASRRARNITRTTRPTPSRTDPAPTSHIVPIPVRAGTDAVTKPDVGGRVMVCVQLGVTGPQGLLREHSLARERDREEDEGHRLRREQQPKLPV